MSAFERTLKYLLISYRMGIWLHLASICQRLGALVALRVHCEHCNDGKPLEIAKSFPSVSQWAVFGERPISLEDGSGVGWIVGSVHRAVLGVPC